MLRKIIYTSFLFFFLSFSVRAETIIDTPENRMHQADLYLQGGSFKIMVDEVTEITAASMSADQREFFIKIMAKQLDTEAFRQTIKSSMVKIFTAEEIKAMTDYESSTVGRSIMKKQGATWLT